ncbi:unnamed protein product [Leuciscus chuanchicus]
MRAEDGEGTGLPDPGGFHPDHMTDALSPPTSTQMWRDTPYLLEEGSDGTHEDGTILKQKSSLCAPRVFLRKPECKIADLNLAAACHHAIRWEAGRAPSSGTLGTLGTLGTGQGHAEPFRASDRNTSSTGLYT